MEQIAEQVYRILFRIHQSKPKFRGDGDLAYVEFVMLIVISAMLDVQNSGMFYWEKDSAADSHTKSSADEETAEKGITLGDIIKMTDMSMSAASKKISILEKKGLIKRYPSKLDRRNIYITLTEKGRDICERDKAKKHAWIEEITRRMGEENMEQLLMLMDRMLDIMNEIETESEK